jgi:hypothetical protein
MAHLRWQGLADLAVRARDRLSPRGFKKCQEVDPAWPPVQVRCGERQDLAFPRKRCCDRRPVGGMTGRCGPRHQGARSLSFAYVMVAPWRTSASRPTRRSAQLTGVQCGCCYTRTCWTDSTGETIRGRAKVLAMLKHAAQAPARARSIELRDGQIYRWLARSPQVDTRQMCLVISDYEAVIIGIDHTLGPCQMTPGAM